MKRKHMQLIGLDIGRGFAKGYTEKNNKALSVIIQSCYKTSLKEEKDFTGCKHDSFYFKSGRKGYVVGEKCHVLGSVYKTDNDDKTSNVVEVLVQSILAKIGDSGDVVICLGIPNGLYKDPDKVREIEEYYTGKEYSLEYNGETKDIKIIGCYCFREADAVNWLPEVSDFLSDSDTYGIISVGYRTIERSYYSNGTFVPIKSASDEEGNINYLNMVKDKSDDGYSLDLYELDVTNDEEQLNDLEMVYDDFRNNIKDIISYGWVNREKIKIVITGGLLERTGITKKMVPENFYLVQDPVIASAKGLYNFLVMATKEDEDETN